MVELTLDGWRNLTTAQRKAEALAIEARSRGALVLLRMDDELGVPAFAHVPSKVVVQLVPGGTHRVGFGEDEWRVLEEQYKGWDEAEMVDAHLERLPAVREVTVQPFLLAARTLDRTQIEYLGASPDERAAMEASRGRKEWDYQKVIKLPAAQYVAYLEESGGDYLDSWDAVTRVEGQLGALGLRLPREAEWEAAARAGRWPCPFSSGTKIPDDPGLGINPFGLMNIGSDNEVCADPFTEGANTPRVVKGGAACIYPWQGCGEWTLMLCGCRTDGGEDGFLTLRPALDLPV